MNAAQKWLTLGVLVFSLASCKSPLELDVDRSMRYLSGEVPAKRASLYYYYADSSYEVVFSDTALLNTIVIDTLSEPMYVTIPQIATPRFGCIPTSTETPIVNAFSFSINHVMTNDSSSACVNPKTYFYAQHLDKYGATQDYQWFADYTGRRLDIGFIELRKLRTIKGRIVIRVVNPENPTKIMTTNALLTLDY
ncbi:hypothetical protein BH10BAC6_BH10BAC6_00160 [soil metagenome]